MLRTGHQYLQDLKARGGEFYIGGEKVTDVTTHPAFMRTAQSIAEIYDTTSDPAQVDNLTYIEEETGERCNPIYMRPRNAEDIKTRNRVHTAWAKCTWGWIGRAPDHVAGWVTGMACMPELFDQYDQGFSENILNYWRYCRDNDLYLAYAILPPASAKATSAVATTKDVSAPDSSWGTHNGLRVVKEDDTGVTVWGFKLLATAAVFADEIFIGNYQPLAVGQEPQAITCALPINTPGMKFLCRRPYARADLGAIDYPFSERYDEGDAVVFCDNVHVPWERVFVHDHTDTVRAVFNDTPAAVLGNAQAHIRLLEKMRLMLGVIKKVLEMNGVANLPPVRDTLGNLATRVAIIESLLDAGSATLEEWPNGYVAPDRQAFYATMAYTLEYFPEFAQILRELLGSHPFQQPADISIFENPETSEIYSQFAMAEPKEAIEKYKLMKLAWDLIGSEFASRHTSYEMFYNGAKHVARMRAHHYFRWDVVEESAQAALDSIGDYDSLVKKGGAAK
jgi:4-hydroxyphenylacetate 3-monooxygenase